MARLAEGDEAVFRVVFVGRQEVGRSVDRGRDGDRLIVVAIAVVDREDGDGAVDNADGLRDDSACFVVGVGIGRVVVDDRSKIPLGIVSPGDRVLPVLIRIGVGLVVVPDFLDEPPCRIVGENGR